MSGFWTGGAAALEAALQKQFDERLAALQEKLQAAASSGEAAILRRHMAELRAEFKSSARRDLLF